MSDNLLPYDSNSTVLCVESSNPSNSFRAEIIQNDAQIAVLRDISNGRTITLTRQSDVEFHRRRTIVFN